MNNSKVQDIISIVAWKMLEATSSCYLIDVRTELEWSNIGYPNLSSLNKDLIKNSWRLLPNMDLNLNFVKDLTNLITNKDADLIFICKTGVRSMDAALTMNKLGYKNCYNIIEGFEGIKEKNDLGIKSGWKSLDLPWQKD